MIQRVTRASVTVGDRVTGAIEKGYLILVGFTDTDTSQHVEWMADKIVGLRLFPDDDDKMNLSLVDTDGAALVVSQFTLYGDVRKGRRPSFVNAAHPETAIPLYEELIRCLQARGIPTEQGEFGAMMDVELVNWGPVTISIER